MNYNPHTSPRFGKARLSGLNPPALAVIALVLAASLFRAEPALAMRFVVTDEAGLADAINQSNAMPLEDNVIEIDLHGAIVLTAPLPNIRSNVEIFGPGQGALLLSGGNQFRVFFVESGTVSIHDMLIADGFDGGRDGADGQDGGAGGGAAGLGGAMFVNSGNVTIQRTTFDNSAAIGGNGGDRFSSGSMNPGNDGGGGGAGMNGDGLLNADDDLGGDGGASGALGGDFGLGGGRGEAGGNGGEGAGAGGGGKGRSLDLEGFVIADEEVSADGTSSPTAFGEAGGNGGHGGYGGGGGGGGEGGKGSGSDASTDDIIILSSNGGAGGNGGHGGFGGGGGAGGRGKAGSPDGLQGLGGEFGGDAGPPGEQASGGGGAGLGGALFIRSGSVVRIFSSTFSNNSAISGAGGQGRGGASGDKGLGKGGAIFIDDGADVFGIGVTFENNVASDSGDNTNDNDDLFAAAGDPFASASSSGGGGCFIATAAYGTPLAEDVNVLRDVRDTYLLDNALGTVFVDAYYRLSPPVANLVAQHSGLALAVRLVLLPIIAITSVFIAYPGLSIVLILAAFMVLAPRRKPTPDHIDD